MFIQQTICKTSVKSFILIGLVNNANLSFTRVNVKKHKRFCTLALPFANDTLVHCQVLRVVVFGQLCSIAWLIALERHRSYIVYVVRVEVGGTVSVSSPVL